MIKTVIFDMDGVIVDTEPVHHYAYRLHFKDLNIEVSPEMYASFTETPLKTFMNASRMFINSPMKYRRS